VIHWLIDTVSKNATFILNIPGKPDGTIDSKEIAVIDKIGAWMQVNGEAIYSTRPWKIPGEGPNAVKSGSFHGESVSQLGPKDIRFTQNKSKTVVYAIILGWPTEPVMIKSLATSAATNPGKVANVQLIGTGGKLSWKQTSEGLRVELPKSYHPPTDFAASLKVFLA
jgi:alpha-L-fucosidase